MNKETQQSSESNSQSNDLRSILIEILKRYLFRDRLRAFFTTVFGGGVAIIIGGAPIWQVALAQLAVDTSPLAPPPPDAQGGGDLLTAQNIGLFFCVVGIFLHLSYSAIEHWGKTGAERRTLKNQRYQLAGQLEKIAEGYRSRDEPRKEGFMHVEKERAKNMAADLADLACPEIVSDSVFQKVMHPGTDGNEKDPYWEVSVEQLRDFIRRLKKG
ncbi:hypothetical protein [uncultured Roseobacter sp.]|uniref:hypothetical protein n=1 Tax=uncultured Roseobacter sp. TaxID=114847 RepID=UPI0026160FCB|nr:hypothetical protein [uncultured Roseobacter sp.]